VIVGTEFGMFVPALIPAEFRTPGDPRILQIRTRRRVDLERLRDMYMPFLEIVVLDKSSDFQFRAYCSLEEWGAALFAIAQNIDYINEKNPTKDKYHDEKLYHLYEKIWSATLQSFPTGSMWGQPQRNVTVWPHNVGKTAHHRTVETVYRTENREWSMRGASPQDLAALMREIDSASDGVEVPTDAELNTLEHVTDPHISCSHRDTKSARRNCNRRRHNG
jgi:hypothetical protein